MRTFIIISGGAVEDSLACEVIRREQPETIIAADAGMEFLYRSHIKPDVIVGDFDSVDAEILSYFQGQQDIQIRALNPMKDDTDTEYAIRLAIEMGAEQIVLLGGTGSRLDHVLGNIELLGIGLQTGVEITLLDGHNRIRMIDKGISIRKQMQTGKYVSLIPYTEEVTHLYLRGFKYPLSDACLRKFSSLGISNEIVEEEARISFERGILLVIESKD